MVEGIDEREARDANRTVFDPYIYVWWMMERSENEREKNGAEVKEEVESRKFNLWRRGGEEIEQEKNARSVFSNQSTQPIQCPLRTHGLND